MTGSLIDEIEYLATLTDSGHITPADAAHRLLQFCDGGLTAAGAARLMGEWRGRGGRYEQFFHTLTGLL